MEEAKLLPKIHWEMLCANIMADYRLEHCQVTQGNYFEHLL